MFIHSCSSVVEQKVENGNILRLSLHPHTKMEVGTCFSSYHVNNMHRWKVFPISLHSSTGDKNMWTTVEWGSKLPKMQNVQSAWIVSEVTVLLYECLTLFSLKSAPYLGKFTTPRHLLTAGSALYSLISKWLRSSGDPCDGLKWVEIDLEPHLQGAQLL